MVNLVLISCFGEWFSLAIDHGGRAAPSVTWRKLFQGGEKAVNSPTSIQSLASLLGLPAKGPINASFSCSSGNVNPGLLGVEQKLTKLVSYQTT